MESRNSHKILVVEDEGLIAHDISSHLEAMGHQVVATASTAEEAIEKAADADLVLMDIHLDGRADGVEAAVAIRDRYHVPVVFPDCSRRPFHARSRQGSGAIRIHREAGGARLAEHFHRDRDV